MKEIKKRYKPKRGRKSPNRITIWEKKFSKRLRKFHGNFAKKTFHRLMKKSSTLRSTLKRRKSNLKYHLQRLESYYINLTERNVIIALLYYLLIIWYATILYLCLWVVAQLLITYR